MSTEVNWQQDDLNSALNEEFEVNFNNIGMDSFNMNEALLALPTLKNEHSNYDNKFQTQQTNSEITNLNLNSFNDNNLTNQNLQQSIITGNNGINSAVNQTATNSNLQKSNTIITKFSNKSNLNELELMELKQNVQKMQQQNTTNNLNNVCTNIIKRSPVESPISLNEMQQQNSPNCHSENSSIKSSISPASSSSSSPNHYSAGYSNVHMLRNSIINEPTISINQTQQSTIGFSSASNFFQDKEQDGRPIAIVQGKKNRHNLNDGDDEQVNSLKKIRVNSNLNGLNSEQLNNLQQLDQTSSSSTNPSPNNNVNDFRHLMQNHSFNCGLQNQLGNNLQNNLICNNQNLANQDDQQTDNANLFPTAYCNTHEDCKPQTQELQRYSQRSDFGFLHYCSNRLNSSPLPVGTSVPAPSPLFIPQTNQYMADSTITPQSQSSPFLYQQHRNANVFRSHFQYILSANTSMASKTHEDSMTYLNQGQSYEIKLRKISGLELNGNILKTVIRIGFQERRLQYMEKELLQQWKQQRPSERILEIDIPLSYGVFEIIHPDDEINKVEFAWNSSNNKDSGIFIKLNAISTEFTPKKHGGEKGVPFRLIIETHMYSNNSPISLNTFIEGASCQIKVFKPKGADRKHKTDKEKMAKRSLHEQQKYLPSYDCTIFTPCSIEALFLNNNSNNYNNQAITNGDTNSTTPNSNLTNNIGNSNNIDSPSATSNDNQNELNLNSNNLFNQEEDCKKNIFMQNQSNMDSSDSSNSNNLQNNNLNNSLANMINFCSSPFNNLFNQNNNLLLNTPLSVNLDSHRVHEWLIANRFEKWTFSFQNFNSNDLINLSREDLIQICELTDGIRLYNCLHSKSIQPKTTIYCSFETGLFRAVYLITFKFEEFREKLLKMVCENSNNDYNLISSKLKNILIIGPQSIKILVTEDVISNLAKESMYILQIEQDPNQEKYDLLLKPYK